MIRYECNKCGELIDDEDNMVWIDALTQYCPECEEEEDEQ